MAPDTELGDSGARRLAGRVIGAAIVAGAAIAVVVTLLQWDTRPQTDDATVRANFVGIAPQVSGHIVDLRVRDNQQVHEGDLLFVVDPRPYEIAGARARAGLALTRKEVEGLRNGVSTADAGVARAAAQVNASAADVVRRETDPVAADAEIARLEAQRVASEAALHRAKAELRHAEDHLARLEPLLPEKFVTEDRVDEARTRRISAAMAAEQARTSILAADAALDEARAKKRAAVATLTAARAQHLATEAADERRGSGLPVGARPVPDDELEDRCVRHQAPEGGQGHAAAGGQPRGQFAGRGLQRHSHDAHEGALIGGAHRDGLAHAPEDLMEDVPAEHDLARCGRSPPLDDHTPH